MTLNFCLYDISSVILWGFELPLLGAVLTVLNFSVSVSSRCC